MQLPESLTADLAWRLPATAERERVAQALCLHFAADHLGMEALEDRLSRVYIAQTPAQLQGLIYDLPPLDTEKMDAGDAALLAPSAVVPARGVLMAFMGGVVRKGTWLIPRELTVWAFMGGFETDAVDTAALDPSEPILRVSGLAIMAGVEVKVRRPSKKMLKRFEAAVDAAKRLPSG